MVNTHKTVISSRVRLARNVNGLPFPNRLNGNEGRLNDFYVKTREVCDNQFKNKFWKVNSLSPLQLSALIENHVISPALCENDFGAVIISDDRTISIMLNEEDHLREQCILSGYRLDEAYRTIESVDMALRSKLDIAFKMPYGHLTSCPTNWGAGMRASVMMFLPAMALNHTVDLEIRNMHDMGLTLRGVYGEGSSADGFTYQISNQSAVGVGEEEILHKVKIEVARLCELEEQAERAIRGISIEDSIWRAYGLLRYAKKICVKEFMDNVALVKLGVIYGILDINIDVLNKLITDIQKNTLSLNARRELNANERDILRAKMVNEKMKF
ncbi:MAG: ATP--guanido phosphotransferase [Clostridia bacterium]|nr:ATP--guanido phosphotransferase [Clostridia bacterium]MDE7329339.1 ATP--guanido phosphotransferase [Clostridia bacterium]